VRQDIVICRKTGTILKTTPIDPGILAEFVAPLLFGEKGRNQDENPDTDSQQPQAV
jgi:hypothetical protein